MGSTNETNHTTTRETLKEDKNTATEGVSLRIQDIRKTFGDGSIVACEDISLDIQSKDFVVLLGPSGCGKTTTLRCIAGLERPDSGHIYIGDEDITTEKPKNRNLAFVFQSIALFPHMSVRKNIRFGLDMKGDFPEEERKNRVQNAAEILGITELLDRSTDELSGGQQQRVSLGRAMVMDPAAFLLDEPFSALDANLRDQLQTEVKQLQRELNTAMVFVTHDQEEAMSLGDKIVVMDDGRIQQVGSPYDIYNEPANQFVAEFIGSPSTNFISCSVVETADGIGLESDHFSVSLPDSETATLGNHISERVSLGVRPEDLVLDSDNPLFEAYIDVVEPQGTLDTVHLDLGNYPLRATTDQGKVASQRKVAVSFKTDELWVFDEGGERLV